jgi:hypothetical protein
MILATHRCRGLLPYRFSVLASLAVKDIQIWHVSESYMPDKLHFTAAVRTVSA